MLRLACDSDNLADLLHTPFIFTYADLVRSPGALHALRARFPGSCLKLIDRGLGDPAGVASAIRVVDDETGANNAQQSAEKMLQWVTEGRPFVTGYANRSNIDALFGAARAIGLADHEWFRWIATLDGTMRIAAHPYAMVQFIDAETSGLHVDFSVVWNDLYHPEVA